MKSWQGKGLGGEWLTRDLAAALRGVSVLCHLLQPDGLHISSTLGLALLGAINSSLNDPKQVQNTPEKCMWLVFSCLAGPNMGSMVDRSEWGEQAGHRLQLLAALPCGSA